MRDYMIENIYPGNVLVSGYPRNSVLLNNERRDKIRKDCNFADKRVLVYMPTWRGLLTNKETDKQLKQLDGFFADIDSRLKDTDIFFVKLHPYVKDKMDYSGYRHIREFPAGYETYDFLTAADVLVTDYSSIMFDFGVTKRKIILFAYDKDEYLKDRGLYIGLEDLGLPVTENVEELIQELNDEHKGYDRFYERFCSNDSLDTPERICEILFSDGCKSKAALVSGENNHKSNITADNRKKILIYMKGFKNDIESRNRINMINSIDTDKYDVYICMKSEEVKNTEMLSLLKDISYMPIMYEVGYRRSEYFRLRFLAKLQRKSIQQMCRQGHDP